MRDRSARSRVRGTIRVPGDKSISHRYALLGAIAAGATTLRHYAPGGDCASTLACLAALGVEISRQTRGRWDARRVGSRAAAAPGSRHPTTDARLRQFRQHHADAGGRRRGVTRSSRRWPAIDRCRRRPMRRIMAPLTRMGARIEAADGDRPPLTITGGRSARHRLHSGSPERAGEERGAAGGPEADGRTGSPSPHLHEIIRSGRWRRSAFRWTVGIRPLASTAGSALRRGRRVPGDISSAAFPGGRRGGPSRVRGHHRRRRAEPLADGHPDVLRRFGARVEVELTAELARRAGRPHPHTARRR